MGFIKIPEVLLVEPKWQTTDQSAGINMHACIPMHTNRNYASIQPAAAVISCVYLYLA